MKLIKILLILLLLLQTGLFYLYFDLKGNYEELEMKVWKIFSNNATLFERISNIDKLPIQKNFIEES